MDIIVVTAIVVVVTLVAMALGPMGQQRDSKGAVIQGPVGSAVVAVNNAVDDITGKQPLFTVSDPTAADPRISAPGKDGKRPSTPTYDAATGLIRTLPNYMLWMLFLFLFSYLGANLPIWRF